MTTRDLANLSDLQDYLQSTPFASSRIDVLSGGTANFACRLHLLSPHEGRPTVVLKHAKDYVFTSASKFPFSLERQKLEVEALKLVGATIPADAFVTVPKVHMFDEKEAVIVMDDCGLHSTTLKQFVLDGKCTVNVAQKIGLELGTFLRRVHAINRERYPAAMDYFASNGEGKRISAWATYGRLVQTLNGEDPLPALSNPPLTVSESQLNIIAEVAKTTSELMMAARDTLVMGDFWSGNILLDVDPLTGTVESVSVVDWELVKAGLPGLDIGQFYAEADLLRRFHPSTCEEATSEMIVAFQKSYGASAEVDRAAVTHWGTHLVTWTPRVQWGSKETTRETVTAGVRMLISNHSGTDIVDE